MAYEGCFLRHTSSLATQTVDTTTTILGNMSPQLSTPQTPHPPVVQARPEHAQGIIDLRDQLATWMLSKGVDQWHTGEFTMDHIMREIHNGEWWVMQDPRDHAQVLASVRVIWEDLEVWGPQEIPSGYVHGVAVNRSLAGTGAGPELVAAAERVTAASGRKMIRLDCENSNPVLKRFYQGLGYTPLGVSTFQVPPDYRSVTVLLHEKPLK